jgi:hypothetical protein
MKLNGKQIAASAFLDVENFFYHSAKFKIVKEYDQKNMVTHATCSGVENKMRIRLSQDLCCFEAVTIKDYIFVLIIVCHELAHYLNNHNSHRDSENLDSIAIEARADHFGAQILMTLLTFGNNTLRNIAKYQNILTQDILFKAISEAIKDIYDKVFSQGGAKKYPNPEHRAMLLIAGCLSFFNRFYRPLPESITLLFVLTAIRELNFPEYLYDEKQLSEGDIIQDRIHKIHQDILSRFKFKMDGLKYKYGYFLSANFDQTMEERQQYKQQLDNMIANWTILNSVSV